MTDAGSFFLPNGVLGLEGVPVTFAGMAEGGIAEAAVIAGLGEIAGDAGAVGMADEEEGGNVFLGLLC